MTVSVHVDSEDRINPERVALRGPIAEIVALTPVKRAYAEPNDCPGCSLEFIPGTGWCGHLGSLATLVGIPLGNLASGRVTALVAGAESFFSGGAWGSGAPGDGGTQGRFLGTYDDQTAVEAIADPIPGDLATTRDGKSYVFAAVV